MSASVSVTRKQLAFAMRAMAGADVVQLMWSGISWFDGKHYTINHRDVDAANCSPLDTIKVPRERLDEARSKHTAIGLHAAVHGLTGRPCVAAVHNENSSWLAAQRLGGAYDGDCLPAYDLNAALFSSPGDVAQLDLPLYAEDPAAWPDSLPSPSDVKAVVLPNRCTAVVGDTLEEAVMRSIYLNFAIDTVRAVEASGREGARVVESAQLERAREVWSTQRTYADYPEMKLLRRRMQLPGWWDRVELSEFSDDNVDELDLVAAVDIPGETVLAKVGGVVYPEPTKYTIRLANNRHVHMDDGGGSDDSVFARMNHSFSPNVRAVPLPDEECVAFVALRLIKQGESLSFDYTTTEERFFAAPFTDVQTGQDVGR